MSRYVKVSAVSPAPPIVDLSWDPNRQVDCIMDYWDGWLEKVLPQHPDLIALPEVYDRPSNLRGDALWAMYEARGDRVRRHYLKMAQEYHTNIAFPTHRILSDGTRRNAIEFLNRSGGEDGAYHKNHLVIDEYTKSRVLYGKEAKPIPTDFGTVGGVICFDLNFQPLWEKYKADRPDLLVFCSMYHGGLMQNFWAYHCQSWFLGCVSGDECTIINPVGETVARSTNYFPYVTADINLDCAVVHLDGNWERLRAAEAKYGRGFRVFDPGHVGCVLLTCEDENHTVDEIIDEFGIERWDSYYKRSLEARDLPGRLEP